ncbi:MAG: hypothetical protein M3Y58_11670 [Chloroflexota bacterium]|nr:hypothetical protein [Chloroflexota bacterium]
MLVHSSDGCMTATFDARADRDAVGLLRWLILGAAGLVALVLTLTQTVSVGAAAPATYDTTICISYFVCYNSSTGAAVSNTNSGYPTYTIPNAYNTYPTYTAPNVTNGYPSNAAVSAPYFDPRYGFVQVVTDSSGNLIDINAQTGQRIYPVFPDYGNGFVGGNFVNVGTFPNTFVNNGCPAGNFSCLGFNNVCPVGNFSCLGNFPYFGYPYSTGVYSGNYTVVAPSGNPIVVGPPFRVKEVAAPTVTTPAVAQPAAPIAPTVAPAVAPAPAPAAANTATALNPSSAPATAPVVSTGSSGVHVLSAPAVTAPKATTEPDDHRG